MIYSYGTFVPNTFAGSPFGEVAREARLALNFGEVSGVHCKMASKSGLCFARPPQACDNLRATCLPASPTIRLAAKRAGKLQIPGTWVLFVRKVAGG